MSCKGLPAGSMSELINQKGTNMPSIQKVLVNTFEGLIITVMFRITVSVSKVFYKHSQTFSEQAICCSSTVI